MGRPTGWARAAIVAVSASVVATTACASESGVVVVDAIRTRPESSATTVTTDPTTDLAATPTTSTVPVASASPITPTTSVASASPTVPGRPTRRAGTTVPVLCTLWWTVTACSGSEADPVDATPPSEPAVCAVSDLIVPDCGAWFGVSSPSLDGEFDYTRGLAEYRSVVATPPDILRFYERGATPFPNAEHRALAEPVGGARSILHFSWKPSLDLTWREIADGGADAALDTVATAIDAYPHRLFLTIHHEPENDVVESEASGMTAADYVAMYRHVATGLRARGVRNAVFVMSYIGFDRWAGMIDDLYPGDDVVDWIAWDPYAVDEIDSFAELVNDADGAWPGFYEWATAKAPGTPLMLAEWGFNLPRQPWAAASLDDAVEVLRARFPAIKALVYWNDRGDRFDSRLRGDDDSAAAFAVALADLAADPFFNRVTTAEVPPP